MVMTSGSTYVIGGAFGPKSRGGVVTVLAGSAGFPAGGACARTTRGASAGITVLAPTAPRNVLREMPLPFFMGQSSSSAETGVGLALAFNKRQPRDTVHSVFGLYLLGTATTLRPGMWHPFTIVHPIHPLMDELLFLCLIERIARSEKLCTGLAIDTSLGLLLQPLPLCVSECREKTCLGSFLPDPERFFGERLLLHSLVAFLPGAPEWQGLKAIVVRPNIRLRCT